jgi:hypothetical protein
VRALLIIFATLAALVIGLTVAIASGWVRLAHADPFARAAGGTQLTAVPESDDAPPTAKPQASDPAFSGARDPLAPPADRAIVLRAEDARLTGRNVRLSELFRAPPGGGGRFARQAATVERAITGWSDPADSAEWTADVPRAGKYTVTLDYSTGSAGPGGAYVFTAGDAKLSNALEPTRGGRAFQLVDVGVINLPKGPVRVTLGPAEATRESLMNLRGVRLFLTE